MATVKKTNAIKTKQAKTDHDVTHVLNLEEVRQTLAKHIQETRGTLMEVQAIRIRGNKLVASGMSMSKKK